MTLVQFTLKPRCHVCKSASVIAVLCIVDNNKEVTRYFCQQHEPAIRGWEAAFRNFIAGENR